MRPLAVSHTIDAPREQVFAFLSDVANQAEFADHYLGDLRLERVDSRGLGASFRFRLLFPPARWWGDLAVTALDLPHRIAAHGSMGRIGRIPIEAVYTLTTVGHGMTRVTFGFESNPSRLLDRFKEALGMRLWMSMQLRRALKRLAAAIEGDQISTRPIRVAAG